MEVNSNTKAAMSRMKFQTLIDYHIGDMERRGCTNDSIVTNRGALVRFARFISREEDDGDDDSVLDDITEKYADAYITQLFNRKVRWRRHPNRDPQPGKLSPFTIRKEIHILKGFGTWLDKEGFENPFGDLVVPKEPKRLVRILSEKEIEKVIAWASYSISPV